ncbi:hypothetical protein ACHAXR_009228 [Thalassiosira sp. AJA248-18]
MLRPSLLPSILAFMIACSEVSGATRSNPIRERSGSGAGPRTRHTTAFAPSRPLWVSPLKQRVQSKTDAAKNLSHDVRMDKNNNLRIVSSLPMIPSPLSLDALLHHHVSSSPAQFLPSILTGEAIPIDESFQDQVSLSDLTSDSTLQVVFAASAVAIILLFVAKAIVTQMDEAVKLVAMDFDRVMKLKYPKKWAKFMTGDVGDDVIIIDEDRLQKIVEEMEKFTNEEPEFMERVMQDVERMKR